MSATATIHAGAVPTFQVTLTNTDGTAYAITSGWTVQACLKREINGRMKRVSSSIAVTEGAVAGDDWPNGVITFEVPQTDTKVLRARRHELEVLVEYSAGKDRRWTIEDIKVKRGVLPLSS